MVVVLMGIKICKTFIQFSGTTTYKVTGLHHPHFPTAGAAFPTPSWGGGGGGGATWSQACLDVCEGNGSFFGIMGMK